MRILRRFHLNNPLGNRGEDIAARYLRGKGFSILERNYRNNKGRAFGEIDIVARDRDELVFVEVKARTGTMDSGIHAEEAITAEKLRRLSRIAEVYVRERNVGDGPYRFDAISVLIRKDGKEPEIRHLQSIFL
ncbi:MAG: YraN family protein [Candidatus Moranbacteria bacterium]|nr:YraN family protein [Candidatus Moranbacteria bacterium]